MNKFRYLGKWPLLSALDRGGNGQVWRTHLDGQDAAVKVLMKHDRVSRFKNEVEGMRRLQDIAGILPILDAEVPETSSKSAPAWFVMALATPLRKALGDKPKLEDVVSAVGEIALVLSHVHARGFSHRDIKPENLFLHESQWSVGDFGLVAFDDMLHETVEGEKLGPLHYIAPEMLNDALGADGRPADVFSIAKTLWVLATGQTYPLPGPYSAASPMCQLRSYVASHRTAPLDLLIERCSAMEPSARPTMDDIANELKAWLQEPVVIPVGPLKITPSPVWIEIADAADRERTRVRWHSEAHQRKTMAVKALEARMIVLYNQVQETLSNAHFIDIQGPTTGTKPPGVIAWLPIKENKGNRVGIEVRAWFSFDWAKLESDVCSAMLIANLLVQSGGTVENQYSVVENKQKIYDRCDSFLIGGSKEEATVQAFSQDITELLGKWVTAALERRESLG